MVRLTDQLETLGQFHRQSLFSNMVRGLEKGNRIEFRTVWFWIYLALAGGGTWMAKLQETRPGKRQG